MPTASWLETMATEIKTARDQGLPLKQITAQHAAFDTAAAYQVALLVHNLRLAEGSIPVGRKIGFTNAAMWAQYGVSAPIWGYVYDTTVTYLPEGPGTSIGHLCSLINPKIEPEIIFHFHSAPPPGGTLAEILACIDWVAHGFEMVQSPYPDWKFQAQDAIAVGSLHGRLLVGKRQPVHVLGANLQDALAAFTLALSCDGQVQETGKGTNVLGNPLAAVQHLIHVLAAQPPHQSLQANELVTTGTVTSAFKVQAGQTWQTDLRGIDLPGLSVAFVD